MDEFENAENQQEYLDEKAEYKAVIQKAGVYLARCEQYRAGLERKLAQKKFSSKNITAALDFLEEKHYLDDARYASFWVRNHCAFKNHGKIRVLKELISKGIAKSVAENAINEYFSNHPEEELCIKAYEKAASQGKQGEKLLKFLMDSGFPYRMIQWVIKSHKGED